jgi:WD40 repeat protein
VCLSYRWNAHTDTINYVTYVPELDCLTSCSFDCNVYIWKWRPDPATPAGGDMRKIGSLVLGTERLWKIKIDKSERVTLENKEAEEKLLEIESLTLDQLFAHKKKDSAQEKPLMQTLKAEHAEVQQAIDK